MIKYVDTFFNPSLQKNVAIAVFPDGHFSSWTEEWTPDSVYRVDYEVQVGWIFNEVTNLFEDPGLTLQDFQRAHDQFLNAAARARNYDSIHTASLRAAYPGPWHDEGVAYATWMDTVNVLGYQILNDVQQGSRPMFNNVEEYVALLPPFVYP